MEAGLTLAIISDIHAYGGERSEPPSFVRSPGSNDDPFGKLISIAGERGWSADLLVCPGDICDKADADGLTHAWSRLLGLADALDARLVATAGNHDLDSRLLTSGFDPKGALQQLTPPFPVGTVDGSDSFWSRNYAIVEVGDALIVSLNSAAFHGYHAEGRAQEEFRFGRVSRFTVDRLFDDLGSHDCGRYKYFLLVCHHHPQVVGPFRDVEGDSAMKDANYLLHKLDMSGYNWLIIHGHRHLPYLDYARSSVTVLSSGSFSRLVGDIYGGTVGNQFYILQLGTPEYAETIGLDQAGTFESWNWIGGDWVRAPQLRGLPPHGGFGWRGSTNALSTAVQHHITSIGAPVKWPDLVDAVASLRHIIPTDLAKLLHRISADWAALTPPLEEIPVGWPPDQVSVK